MNGEENIKTLKSSGTLAFYAQRTVFISAPRVKEDGQRFELFWLGVPADYR